MKVFIAKTSGDTPQSFQEVLKYLRARKDVKTFLIGESGHEWDEIKVDEPIVKIPKELKNTLCE